ncbi:kynureninase [Shouchella shacheensis]|uniref:kynureninase n=1 Tax=Shouchella shacheensis TaxID=1649580 RepID=UPI0007402763|nr:kynureninase [Shouchella shacheensis]
MLTDAATRVYAEKLDENDPLNAYASLFYKEKQTVYVDGNSLGLLSTLAEEATLAILESWKRYGIDGWTEGEHPWFTLSESLASQMAPLLGAHRDEVMVTGSTTSNLHQLLATFYKPDSTRTKIVADELNFPTDLYALDAQVRLHQLDPQDHLQLIKSRDGHTLAEEDILAAMTDDVAVVILSSVLYRSGQVLDMARLTKAAHERGILIGFDLCHSIGSLPHSLSKDDVDFAFWCSYKHLNGGPGSVGGLFVNRRFHSERPGLAGWFGSDKEKQFDLATSFTKAAGAGAYQMGTPHVLSLAPLIGSLELFSEVGIENIRRKSLQLTDYMLTLLSEFPETRQFKVMNPRSHRERGAHVYLEHPEAARICKALKAQHVIPDFRAPSGIRMAPVALYNSFVDVWACVRTLAWIMREETYKNFDNERGVIA